MAEIFAFSSADGQTATKPRSSAASFPRPEGIPDEVWHAVESVRTMRRVHGMRYCEIPVPESMADYGIGVSLTCTAGNDRGPAGVRPAQGWIMVLYRHDIPRTWRSHWRCVAYADLPATAADHDTATASRYWNDLRQHMRPPSCAGLNGTVTIKRDMTFPPTDGGPGTPTDGGHAGNDVGCELRVSWTPLDDTEHGLDAGAQIRLWARFLKSMSTTEEEPFR